MFNSVRAAQPLSTPVPSELSAILEAPVRNVLIHINGPPKESNSSASHVRFGSTAEMARSNCDVRFTLESGHSPTRSGCQLWAINRLMHRSKTASLFDRFVGEGAQRRGHSEAKRLRGLEVDRQFELGQPLDWQIAWLGAPEDTTDVESGMTISFRHTIAVAHKAARR